MENSVSTRAAEDARREVQKAERELALTQERLECTESAERAADSEQKLAVELHEALCNWNHTDGCGWFYEIKPQSTDWSGYAHAEYLKRAKALVAEFPAIDHDTLSAIVVQEAKRV
jgi:hypothetical protein